MNTTATEPITAIALTPDTLQAVVRLIAAVEKITLALKGIDGTLVEMQSTLAALQEQSIRQSEALEQIQVYVR